MPAKRFLLALAAFVVILPLAGCRHRCCRSSSSSAAPACCPTPPPPSVLPPAGF